MPVRIYLDNGGSSRPFDGPTHLWVWPRTEVGLWVLQGVWDGTKGGKRTRIIISILSLLYTRSPNPYLALSPSLKAEGSKRKRRTSERQAIVIELLAVRLPADLFRLTLQ